jgi:cytoskeletal protein CcmA (bactofilin family)
MRSEGAMSSKGEQPGGEVTVLSEGCALEGTLSARGPVQIDGAISGGLITDGHASIGASARILGEVRADELSVHGEVSGLVFVRGHLQVAASGAVRGYARYATLEVARGGVVDGAATLMPEAPQPARDDLSEAAE